MKATPHPLRMFAAAGLLTLAGPAFGQTFSSGSTGADGAYAPACAPTPCTVTETLNATGVYNFTTITIPAGVTVRWTRNAANTPVTLLAAGDVTIAGAINVSGSNGIAPLPSGGAVNPGGLGGPGGFTGGNSGIRGGLSPNAGQGPGGGAPSTSTVCAGSGAYGAPANFASLLPLFGGSGGGGGFFSASGGADFVGGSGGGGGGGIVIASSTKLVLSGTIVANGGNFGQSGLTGVDSGGGGSGGAIRLVASQISGAGSLQANGGTLHACAGAPPANPGRIRLEAFTLGFTGSHSPTASQTVAPGPVSPVGTPALVALPVVSVANVAGVASPAAPGGSFTAADVSLPGGSANPVTVTVGIANMPVGPPTAITLRLIQQSGAATTVSVPAASQVGTFASSAASTSVTLPTGQVSVLQAFATTTLTGQIASLFPLIDGEPVQSVAMSSPLDDGKPTLNLVTKSGKEKRFDELTSADQLKVAVAWQALAASQ